MVFLFFFFFKQKTAYEMRISDWSSDVCSSDLVKSYVPPYALGEPMQGGAVGEVIESRADGIVAGDRVLHMEGWRDEAVVAAARSEEHTSELQSLMRISYAVFCLKKKKKTTEQLVCTRHIEK